MEKYTIKRHKTPSCHSEPVCFSSNTHKRKNLRNIYTFIKHQDPKKKTFYTFSAKKSFQIMCFHISEEHKKMSISLHPKLQHKTRYSHLPTFIMDSSL